jgi:hypothetical protein
MAKNNIYLSSMMSVTQFLTVDICRGRCGMQSSKERIWKNVCYSVLNKASSSHCSYGVGEE